MLSARHRKNIEWCPSAMVSNFRLMMNHIQVILIMQAKVYEDCLNSFNSKT